MVEDIMYCYRCAEEDPEFTVVDSLRRCGKCGNDAVLSVEEMLDILNDLYLKGLLRSSYLTDYVDEEYEPEPLDFDVDEDSYQVEEASLEDFNDVFQYDR